MERFEQLDEKLTDFIKRQHLFFVATAGAEGRINLSPKGMDSLRVLDPNTIIWLNLTGSGNETAAHVLENERMTLMFCSYEKQPLILRLYGNAKMISPHDKQWARVSAQLPAHRGARQIFKLNIDLVQTSCGYAIPYYDYQGERCKNKMVWHKTDQQKIISPCVHFCTFVEGYKICGGCFRTEKEIKAWRKLDEQSRKMVLAKASNRQKTLRS